MSLPEYGYLLIYEKDKRQRYAYMEVPVGTVGEHILKIPAGNYHFCISDTLSIENVQKDFKDILHNTEKFIAIETEIFASKYQVDSPLQEVRVISCY